MKRLVILGGGTAGTLTANGVVNKLTSDWTVTVIDPEPEHLYQPGLLFLPFGARDEKKIICSRAKTLRQGVEWFQGAVDRVDPDVKQVVLENGNRVGYDLLVIASGSRIVPEETDGLMGDEWQRSIFDFYTLEGAQALRKALADFEGGRLVVNVVEMPIKCPIAPLEFLFLADSYFQKRRIRDDVDLVFATPLDGAFTKPIASRILGSMLAEKGIRVESQFNTGNVDPDGHKLHSWDEREIDYDLLVTIPTHSGAPFISASGLGNELAFVPTERDTLLVKDHDDIFAIGDATDLPSSKAGSVAHFQGEVLTENLLRAMQGKSPAAKFDGHANCFIESGHGKAVLIDFNYDTEPLPGVYPYPGVGPLSLLKESRLNHLGKLAFRWVYWNLLLPALPMPVTAHMSMAGKVSPDRIVEAA